MVAGENDGEDFRVGEIFERVIASIDGGQFEIGRRRAERENWVARIFSTRVEW
jgi:hypothetical protein